MSSLLLSAKEQHRIESGPWFGALSPARRGAMLTRRGAPGEAWRDVARRAVRVESARLVLLSRDEPFAIAAR